MKPTASITVSSAMPMNAKNAAFLTVIDSSISFAVQALRREELLSASSVAVVAHREHRHLGPAQLAAQEHGWRLAHPVPPASSGAPRPLSVAATTSGRMADAIGDEMRSETQAFMRSRRLYD
jgi:hypothetical protein